MSDHFSLIHKFLANALGQEQGFGLWLISMPGRGIFRYAHKCERYLYAI